MDVLSFSVFGKKIITYYQHYIMERTIHFADIKSNLHPVLRTITIENIDELKKLKGFDIEYIKKLLKKYENKVFGIGAFIDNEIVGYAWCAFKGARDRQYLVRETDVYIFDVFVGEQFRGHGFAPMLIDELIKTYVGTSENVTICLAVRKDNISAIKAYKKIGFVVKGEKAFLRVLKVNIPQHKL